MHSLHGPTAVRATRTLARVLEERLASRHPLPEAAGSEGEQGGEGEQEDDEVTVGEALAVARAPAKALRLLDAAGGSGVYAVCLAKAMPTLHCDLGELPEVLDAVRAHGYVPADVSDRVKLRALDLFCGESWDRGSYEAVLLSSVLHDWSEAACDAILAHAYEALSPGGVLLVHEVNLDQPCAEEAVVAACLSLHMV